MNIDTTRIVVIIATIITSNQLHGSQQQAIPFKYNHNRNITQKILTCFDQNDNAFVCYAGYKIIKEWYKDGGNYYTSPNIEKKTNILVETQCTITQEHFSKQVPEIDNDKPVADIARFKNKYLIAHKNKLLTYEKSYIC